MKRCFNCFCELEDNFAVCPKCGEKWDCRPCEPIHLAPGTVLAGRYILGKRIGSGGFGIIYAAYDTKLEAAVAVKELFISSLMTRAVGQKNVIISQKSRIEFDYRKDRFLAEARNMAKFSAHKTILNVFDFFEENSTAYIAMERLEGQSLSKYLKDNNRRIDRSFALFVTNEVGKALISLHESGIIHRDVAPDNIFICSGKEIKVKLLDLGSAKLSTKDESVVDIVLKPGYSPPEQYDASEDVGPWMDVYALAATLYVMLTGTKPDESTNRKGKGNDKVVPPNMIDNTIEENLSNAVMKGIAVEKHLRYKTVQAFLDAINGNKKAILPEKEIKLKKRNRILGVCAALVIIGVGAFGVYHYYDSKRSEQVLKSADIELWYAADKDSSENDAMEMIKDEFEKTYPDVSVNLYRFDEDEYIKELEKAAEEGTLPDLFESTNLDDEFLENAADVNNVLESENAQKCLFLNQYDDYYSDYKKIPLGIEIPLAIYVTGGSTSVEYSDRYFESPDDFSAQSIAVDESICDAVADNFDVENALTREEFIDNACPVLLTSSSQLDILSAELLGYEWECAFYDASKINCGFMYEWSMGNNGENNLEAAQRLLSYMLSSGYQSTLMLSVNSESGCIPINTQCFDEKDSTAYFDGALSRIKNDFVFE